MTRVQLLAREIKKLDRASLLTFRNWFRKYDSDSWDRQIERDVRAGKLEKHSREALLNDSGVAFELFRSQFKNLRGRTSSS